jgi:hypothetical protein
LNEEYRKEVKRQQEEIKASTARMKQTEAENHKRKAAILAERKKLKGQLTAEQNAAGAYEKRVRTQGEVLNQMESENRQVENDIADSRERTRAAKEQMQAQRQREAQLAARRQKALNALKAQRAREAATQSGARAPASAAPAEAKTP